MRALAKTPNDPILESMSDAQWLWAYRNVVKDEEEDFLQWERRLDLIISFINHEAAKHYIEEREALRNSGTSEQQKTKYEKRDLDTNVNSDFELELKAVQLGYDPSSGMTPREFLNSLQEKNKPEKQTEDFQESNKEVAELDIMNASFEELAQSGMFATIPEEDTTVRGNPREAEDNFFDRVFALEQVFNQQHIEQEAYNEESFDPKQPIREMAEEEIREALQREGINPDELDTFEIDED